MRDDEEHETPETLRISIASTEPPWIFSLLGPNAAVNATICDPEGELYKSKKNQRALRLLTVDSAVVSAHLECVDFRRA